jgi:hypothetical protein
MSLIDFELRTWIARYLTGGVSLSEFRRWLLPIAWRAGEPGEPDSRLVRRAELRVAEYMNGHLTDLQRMLATMGPATTGMPAETNVVGSVAGAVVYESAFAAA